MSRRNSEIASDFTFRYGNRTATRDGRNLADLGRFRNEIINFGNRARQLHRATVGILVQHLGIETPGYLGCFINITGVELNFDNREFTFEVLTERHVMDIDDVDEFRQLGIELGDSCIRARHHKRHARNPRIVGRGYIESFDVISARREHARQARQSTDLILEED
jgi:hypothetical protein